MGSKAVYQSNYAFDSRWIGWKSLKMSHAQVNWKISIHSMAWCGYATERQNSSHNVICTCRIQTGCPDGALLGYHCRSKYASIGENSKHMVESCLQGDDAAFWSATKFLDLYPVVLPIWQNFHHGCNDMTYSDDKFSKQISADERAGLKETGKRPETCHLPCLEYFLRLGRSSSPRWLWFRRP